MPDSNNSTKNVSLRDLRAKKDPKGGAQSDKPRNPETANK